MTEKEFEHYQQKTLRYILLSIVHNTNILPSLDEEKREVILNNVFNIMLNSLKPDAAVIWNEEILSLSEEAKFQQSFEDVMDILHRDFGRHKE